MDEPVLDSFFSFTKRPGCDKLVLIMGSHQGCRGQKPQDGRMSQGIITWEGDTSNLNIHGRLFYKQEVNFPSDLSITYSSIFVIAA